MQIVFLNTSPFRSFSALQCYHSLALLLMIFAIGILHDPDRQAYSADAQQYFDLACTALDFNPRTTRLSVEVFVSLQALH